MTTPPRTPTTAAGRALATDVEEMLGVQFKSNEAYRGWLDSAARLALDIEAEARASLDVDRMSPDEPRLGCPLAILASLVLWAVVLLVVSRVLSGAA